MVASAAVAAHLDPTPDLDSVTVLVLDRWIIQVRLADEEVCTLVLARSGRPDVMAGSRRVTGPSVRLVRARCDDTGFAGESITEIEGVIRLERPGPISVRRHADGSVRVVTATGFALDQRWASGRLRTLVADGGSRSPTPASLRQAGVVPSGIVRRLQRATGRTLVEIGLEP